mgnify:CR=1 FL=1|tara:strand:- start:9662 stop:10936 length:1275 start_codon:yes stop_codon:yes gene_type:complete
MSEEKSESKATEEQEVVEVQETEQQEEQSNPTAQERETGGQPLGKTTDERAAEIDHIMNMAKTNPAIKEMPEYQEMMEELSKIEKSKTQEVQDTEQEEAEEQEEETQEETQESEQEEETLDIDDEDDVFGINKGRKGTKYKFKDRKEVDEFMKKKYGAKDYPKLFESVDKWRNDSQQLTQVQEQNEKIVEGLGSLPQPIKDAIQAYSESEDWRSAFSNAATHLDFNAEFEELNKEAVVEHYFKRRYESLRKKLDEEDIDEDEYNDRIEDFYDSSQRLFASDKKTIEKERAKVIKKQEESEEAFKGSALGSVNSLKDEFPNFSSSQLQKIRRHLVNGDINSLFVEDGKYIKDAAKRIAFALYGEKIIKAKVTKAKRTGKNESKEEFFSRGNSKVKTSRSQQGHSAARTEQSVNHLQGQFKEDPYS